MADASPTAWVVSEETHVLSVTMPLARGATFAEGRERNVPGRKPGMLQNWQRIFMHSLIHRWYNNSILILLIRNTRSSNDLASRLGYRARLF
jgi:hypothetical protein